MKKAVIILDDVSAKQGTVVNLIEYSEVSGVALQLDRKRVLWDCGGYRVNIGDRWVDGVFFRENQPLKPAKTTADEIETLRQELSLINGAVLELMNNGMGGGRDV